MRTYLYYKVEVRDPDGKLLKRERRKSRSYVRQWNDIVAAQAGAGTQSVKDTGGTSRSVTTHANNLRFSAAAADDAVGIVVGSGVIAVTIVDFNLRTKITEGTGAGQLNYQASTPGDPAISGSSCSFETSRAAINNSGATVTVKEIGINIRGASTPYYFLGVRDVLAASLDVPHGGAITITYTIKVTV